MKALNLTFHFLLKYAIEGKKIKKINELFETFQGLHYSLYFCCNSQCRGIYLVLLLRSLSLSLFRMLHPYETLHLFFSPHQLILGQRTFDESINKEGKFYFDTLLYSVSHTCDNYSIPGSLYSYKK